MDAKNKYHDLDISGIIPTYLQDPENHVKDIELMSQHIRDIKAGKIKSPNYTPKKSRAKMRR